MIRFYYLFLFFWTSCTIAVLNKEKVYRQHGSGNYLSHPIRCWWDWLGVSVPISIRFWSREDLKWSCGNDGFYRQKRSRCIWQLFPASGRRCHVLTDAPVIRRRWQNDAKTDSGWSKNSNPLSNYQENVINSDCQLDKIFFCRKIAVLKSTIMLSLGIEYMLCVP